MPLKVNVGLSRKVGESNYGSRGASVIVELELELDSSLIGEPAKFQERIRQIYGMARNSLIEELNGFNGHSNGHAPMYGNGPQHSDGHNGNAPPYSNGNGNGHTNGNSTLYPNGNGAPDSNGKRPGVRPATQSQVKAIHAISQNQRLDPARFLTERHGVNRPENLDIETGRSSATQRTARRSQTVVARPLRVGSNP